MALLLTGFVILSCAFIQGINGMDCKWGTSQNIIDEIIHSCPRPLIDSSSQKYCCYSYHSYDESVTMRCCNLWDFVTTTSGYLLVPTLLILLVVSCIVSCICCLCCSCCGCSKRGRVLQPPPVVTAPSYCVTMPARGSMAGQPLLA